MRRSFLLFLAGVITAAGTAWSQPWVPDPLEPASSGGLVAVDRALARLSVHARLLVIGAHPDDEDNALLTWVARGLGGEAAYLSLSRGEGGQNLIGSELGVELGAVRTGELMAARRLEGSRQYFTRAYDFGYTRSLEETFERWPRQVLLEDAVRIVRRFKPQVIVAVFPADERAGHGQHQASAVIAADAFRLGGDERTFPALPGTPWAPQAFFRRAWQFRGEEGTHGYSLAALEPLSGRSLGQLAAASRSFHRSQDMGREQLTGPARGGLVWIAGGDGGAGGEPFAGIDTRLVAIVAGLPDGPRRATVAELLARVERTARQARRQLTPAAVEAAVPALAEILDLLRQCGQELGAAGPETRAARELVAEKAAVAAYGLAAAAGIVLEATADRETVPAGGAVEIEATVWPAGEADVVVKQIEALVETGWLAKPLETVSSVDGVENQRFRVELAEGTGPTMPYYLRKTLRHEALLGSLDEEPAAVEYRRAMPNRLQEFLHGDLYDPSPYVPAEVLGEPFGPAPVRLRFALEIAGRPVTLEREAVYRYADQAFGERRLPIRAVPPVEISLQPALVLLPNMTGDTELRATARSNLAEPVEGLMGLPTMPGEPKAPFSLAGEEDADTARFIVKPPAHAGPQIARVSAEIQGGLVAAWSMRVVSYPHIRPVAVPTRAMTRLQRFDLALPRLDRVGYVRGASDRVPEILAAVGLPIEVLEADDLERAALTGFDAIVVGSRAYEIDAALRRANPRLLEYVRGGGLLLVQYQQYQFVRGGFAPWPLEILRPHGRVTDEFAPVEALVPDHPVFQSPNRLTAADWEGWVQERGLYFAGEWDGRYQPLLAIADPGREAERGGLLVARVGEGRYVYTGLSFFRQLPAGVPGAVRLFVNLLALGER